MSQPATISHMGATVDHLAAIRTAARKLKRAEKAKERAEQARDRAQAELMTAIEAAEAAELRPAAIIRASGMPRWRFYRLKGGNR